MDNKTIKDIYLMEDILNYNLDISGYHIKNRKNDMDDTTESYLRHMRNLVIKIKRYGIDEFINDVYTQDGVRALGEDGGDYTL